ncbi:hypothetical protein M5M67_003452 [Shigella dysenteriae]|nr:hypothetical protein [Shigella dysenteriae]
MKQQTCNIVLTPLFNPLRCFAAGKVFISETTVNKHKEAFACSGQGRAAQNLKAPPTLTRGPLNLTVLKPQQKNIKNKNTTQTQHRATPHN